MGLLSRFFGYRWSLYFVTNGNQLHFAMHENSVVRILGYIMGSYARGGNPRVPWSVHLNFNRKNAAFELRREHFSADGSDLSPLLIRTLRQIDPKFDRIRGAEPIFVEAVTKKKLKLDNTPRNADGTTDFYAYMAMSDEGNSETTFFSLLREIFPEERGGE